MHQQNKFIIRNHYWRYSNHKLEVDREEVDLEFSSLVLAVLEAGRAEDGGIFLDPLGSAADGGFYVMRRMGALPQQVLVVASTATQRLAVHHRCRFRR